MIPKIKGNVICNETIVQNYREICEAIGCRQIDLKNYIERKIKSVTVSLAPTHLRIKRIVEMNRLNELVEKYWNKVGGKEK